MSLFSCDRARPPASASASSVRTAAKEFERLKQTRTVLVEGIITERVAEVAIAKLLFLADADAASPIWLIINSQGGAVTPVLAIVDLLKAQKLPSVHTRCRGAAQGIAALLLAAGHKGDRLAAPDCQISLLASSVLGVSREETGTTDPVDRLDRIFSMKLALETGRPAEEVLKDIRRGRHFTAAEARQYGILDGIEQEF